MAIHRFKCSNELNEKIMEFSDIHKFDSKDNLKEQFETWLKENHTLIENEKQFLKENEYEGEIYIKIFKSIKYYYIKKFLEKDEEKENKKDKERKERKSCDLLKEIKEDINHHFKTNRYFKPSDTYPLFLEKHMQDVETQNTETHIKKCYKNIYYQIKNKYYV